MLIRGVSPGRMDANLKCTAPLKANRSEWSWFAVRKYMINFVECARPSRIIFLKNGNKRCFESSQIALTFSVCTNFSQNSLEVVRFAIQRWLTYVSLTWNHSVLTQKKQRRAYHRKCFSVTKARSDYFETIRVTVYILPKEKQSKVMTVHEMHYSSHDGKKRICHLLTIMTVFHVLLFLNIHFRR